MQIVRKEHRLRQDEKRMAKKDTSAQAPAKKKKNVAEAKPFTEAPRLKVKYNDEIAAQLKEKFGYENVMQIPKLEKVVINMGLGSEKDNPKGMESAIEELSIIAGQKPVVTKAKKSVANFKLRQGMPIGAKVTLRGELHHALVAELFVQGRIDLIDVLFFQVCHS